jgi:hypothetical protein
VTGLPGGPTERLLALRADGAEVEIDDAARLAAMRDRLAAERRALAQRARPEQRNALSEEEKQKLRALGYAEEPPPAPGGSAPE